MFFSVNELTRWLGMTIFEIWLHVVTFFIFTIVAVLKHENVVDTSWWNVFVPLFACDGLNAYFCWIVFIRMYKEKRYRVGGLRLLSSIVLLVCIFVFKILLCQKLSRNMDFSYSEVFAPIFVALQILMVRACEAH